ncbi:MAG: WG repeat-containing protein [Treponema sp.]|uniref:WG repeat-containing protein n=1 Tax=Treponema sp. TaxID=166 RepID=UPI0025E980BD|nr:WG repeat-containing protein [Treponema sp.]MBQ8680792.1 WG repeat-containing protein [Treponema sp.]
MQNFLLKILSIIFYITLIGCSSSRADERVSFFQYNGKRGVINEKREIIIPPEYDEIRYNGSYYVCISQGTDGNENYTVFSDKKKILYQGNTFVTPVSKKYFEVGTEYIVNVQKNKTMKTKRRYGFPRFLANNDDCGCYAFDHGYYKKDFETPAVIPENEWPYYMEVYPFRKNRALVYVDKNNKDNFQVINAKGDVICSDIHASAGFYSEGLCAVKMEDGRTGFIDENGDFVFECPLFVHYWLEPGRTKPPLVAGLFSEGKAVVETAENQWAIYDKSGKKYDWPDGVQKAYNRSYEIHTDGEEFKSGLLLVVKKENGTRKYGYIDHECKVAIPCIFEQAFDFMNDYAIARLNGTDGVIDREGNFYSAESIVNGK